MKKYYILKSILLTFLLAFGSIFISCNAKGFKYDYLIENNGFTYIPFTIIHALILLAILAYDYIKEKNLKQLIITLSAFILLFIMSLIGINNSQLDIRYSFRLLYCALQILTLFLALISILKVFKSFDSNFLED